MCYHQIEQQLRVRALPFVHVGSATGTTQPPTKRSQMAASPLNGAAEGSAPANMVPSLCIQAQHLLGASSSLVRRNIAIELRDWSDPSTCSVDFTLRLRQLLSLDSRREFLNEATGDALQLDSKQKTLTFSTRNIDVCVTLFLNAWDRASRLMLLAREVARAKGPGRTLGLTLRSFDLEQVVFEYDDGLTASLGLCDDPQSPRGSSYALDFGCSGTASKSNPHTMVADSLRRILNCRHDGVSHFWSRFLQVSRRKELHVDRVVLTNESFHTAFATAASRYTAVFASRVASAGRMPRGCACARAQHPLRDVATLDLC